MVRHLYCWLGSVGLRFMNDQKIIQYILAAMTVTGAVFAVENDKTVSADEEVVQAIPMWKASTTPQKLFCFEDTRFCDESFWKQPRGMERPLLIQPMSREILILKPVFGALRSTKFFST